MSNTITAYFKGRAGVAESVYQYDYGKVLVIDGLSLPAVFEAHFANTGDDSSTTVIGQNNRVAIPNACLTKTGIVTVYIYLHAGENDGEVEYVIKFAVTQRARPAYDSTEEERSEFETAIQTAIAMLQNPKKINSPLDENNQVTYGEEGQLLRTKGNGSTEWVDVGLPTDEQTAQAVSDWLDEHPEATTTVQDGSLTESKFSDALKLKTIKEYVTPEMFGAKGDGVADDIDAIMSAIESGLPVVFNSSKTYAIGYEIEDYTLNGVSTKRANYIVITEPTIINGNGATIKLLTNPCAVYNGIRIQGTENVVIDNLKVIGDRDNHTTTYLVDEYVGEWGHCVAVRESNNVVLKNIEASKAWGDGISIGAGSQRVLIANCVSDNSRRNGLTVASSKSVHVTDCVFSNTSGVAPQAGVDIEPDPVSGIILKDIVLERCYSHSNSGSGFEVNSTAFGLINTSEVIDVTLKNCRSESNFNGISFLAASSASAQAYNYSGKVSFIDCYILNPLSHGCLVQFEKPNKTAQCIIDGCVFDGYKNYGVFGDFSHSSETDSIWGGAIIRDSKFTNVPSDTGQYKCAVMWGSVGYTAGKRYDLIIDNCQVDDSNPLYWGSLAPGHGQIKWDKKPIVSQPSGYSHFSLNGLLITNRADNVGFILPSRDVCDRVFEMYCLTGSSCFVARYGYGDQSITTDDKIISTDSTSGASTYSLAIGEKIKLVPYSTNYWVAA
jgi:hypothetical protein